MASRLPHGAGAVAAALAAYAVGSVALGTGVLLARPELDHDRASYVVLAAFFLVNVAVVVTLVARLPRHPITWTLTACVILGAIPQGPELLAKAAGAGHLATGLGNVGWIGGIPMLPLLFALFPDGRPTGRRGVVARIDATALALCVPASMLMGYDVPGTAPVAAACGAVLLVTGIGNGVHLGWRTFRERERERGATPFGALAVVLVLLFLLTEPGTLVFALLVSGPSIAIGYGVLRHHLFGLDVVVRRVAIAAATSLAVLVVYVAAAYALASATGVDRAALVAALVPAIVAATVLGPAYRAVQHVADRRLYGDRRDPFTLLRTLGRDLATTAPDEVPGVVVARVREGLRLPWVAIELDREGSLVPVAAEGTRQPGDLESFDLIHAGTRVGRLLLQPRRGQPSLSRRDRRALTHVANAASPAVSAARLVDELTESRERLVAGRETERARLRRELHDGLSPSLAGMSLALGAARRTIGEMPAEAERLLANVQDEAARSWQVVRGILSDLRPPGLEELGLVGALEDRAKQLFRPADFTIDLVATTLPPLPGAVEIAAYRIATEAMTNAARHSHGHHCVVEISANGRLDIVVTDDGEGVEGPPGIGVRSMTERAADLGGWVHVEPAAGHGTVVRAALPLAMRP